MNTNRSELISVIVTSYNHADYLDQRMQSLLNQTYPNIEIIVIDDFSTDNSVEVLTKYEKYKNVKVAALEKNGGYANATNFGVSLSRGNYLMFAECDDFNEPDHIEVLYNKLLFHERVGVAYCRSNMVDSEGRKFDIDFECREEAFKKMCASDTLVPALAMQKFLLISCVIPNMSAALMRRKNFELVGGLSSNYKVCADWDFWCRMAQICDFYYVTACLNNFRNHLSTVRSTSGSYSSLSEIIEILYSSSRKTPLSFLEMCRFRLNVWALCEFFIAKDFKNGIKLFPCLVRNTFRHDKFSIIFLILRLGIKLLNKTTKVLLRN